MRSCDIHLRAFLELHQSLKVAGNLVSKFYYKFPKGVMSYTHVYFPFHWRENLSPRHRVDGHSPVNCPRQLTRLPLLRRVLSVMQCWIRDLNTSDLWTSRTFPMILTWDYRHRTTTMVNQSWLDSISIIPPCWWFKCVSELLVEGHTIAERDDDWIRASYK